MTLCVVCPALRPASKPRMPDFPLVCTGCRTQVRIELSEIPDLYARLDPSRTSTGSGPKVSGSKEAPLPLIVEVVDLTLPSRIGSADIRMRGDWSQLGGDPDQLGGLSIATELDFWVRDWRESRSISEGLPVPMVATLAGWLLNRLDDACDQHPAIDEFAAKVHRLHSTLRRAVGEQKAGGEPVGRCPAKLRDDTRCNTKLYADPYLDQIACARCGTAWPRRQWLSLAAAQDDVKAEEAA